MLFASSGVAIACQGNGTRIVTAASLVRALEKARGNIKVGVDKDDLVSFSLFTQNKCNYSILFSCFIIID